MTEEGVFQKIYRAVKKIPKGKITTYGAVAKKAGTSPRVVGWALHQNPDPGTIPCHRVVNREGRLAPHFGLGGWREQKRKLLDEGVEFKDEMHINLEKFLISNF